MKKLDPYLAYAWIAKCTEITYLISKQFWLLKRKHRMISSKYKNYKETVMLKNYLKTSVQ